jgi:hypothetical protein
MSQATKKVLSPSDLLTAAAAIAAGTQAYGEVVIFINPAEGEPGHFDWTITLDGFPGTPAQWLDITLPSTDQIGGYGPSSVGQLREGYYPVYDYHNSTIGGADIAVDNRTRAFGAGDRVDGSVAFSDYSIHATWISSYPPNYTPVLFSNFPSSRNSYMGVRFSDIDGYHYGWIGVVRNGMHFDAFAWGYETEPGVPIIAGIPAPGTLAALAFGAVVTRRKRKDD